jgi:hypothetical protein
VIDLHLKSEIDPIAFYAAIISTVALALAVWNAWRKGPRLVVKVTPDIMIIGSVDSEHDEKDLVAVEVINRGDAPTTIVALDVLEYSNPWNAFRRRSVKAYTIPNPQPSGYPLNLPSILKPFEKWSGYIRSRPDLVPNWEDGHHYVAIRSSDRDKAIQKVIPHKTA